VADSCSRYEESALSSTPSEQGWEGRGDGERGEGRTAVAAQSGRRISAASPLSIIRLYGCDSGGRRGHCVDLLSFFRRLDSTAAAAAAAPAAAARSQG